MRFLYAGGTFCSNETMRRFLLIADHVSFLDRPSITFPDWGTIGTASPLRSFDMSGLPITFDAYEPPSGPASQFYIDCLNDDLTTPQFVATFLQGLRDDDFAWRFLQPNANYKPGLTGRQIRDALVADRTLGMQNFGVPKGEDLASDVSTSEGRRSQLNVLLAEASFKVSGALLIAAKTSLLPVTDSTYFSRLMFSRSTNRRYVGEKVAVSPFLGLSVVKAVIPDQVLQTISLDDICRFREDTRPLYKAWTVEMDVLAARLGDVDPARLSDEIQRLIATEVEPKIVDYRREMEAVRDKLFGALVKQLATWELPALSVEFSVSQTWPGLLAAMAALRAAIPAIADYITDSRNVKRHNAMSYLIGARTMGAP